MSKQQSWRSWPHYVFYTCVLVFNKLFVFLISVVFRFVVICVCHSLYMLCCGACWFSVCSCFVCVSCFMLLSVCVVVDGHLLFSCFHVIVCLLFCVDVVVCVLYCGVYCCGVLWLCVVLLR